MPDAKHPARANAWETRRKKYGPTGHRGSYARPSGPPINHVLLPDSHGMLRLLVRLLRDGALSEGQVAKATKLDRVTVRMLVDEPETLKGAR